MDTNESEKICLLSLDADELAEFAVSIGQPKYRAAQIGGFLLAGRDFGEMTSLPAALREKLSESCRSGIPEIAGKLTSRVDGTVKYLFRLCDGETVESVVMSYKYGLTICVSCQVGCRMGCKFCASTIGGRVRDLEAGEILGQVVAAQADLGQRISGVVMMGIGEPLDNYENSVKFLRLASSERGLNLSCRRLSLSSCGLCDKIRRLAKEELPITLSVSLHAADDATRSSLMPVNDRYGIAELLSTCRSYFETTGRRISFEYTLVPGINDGEENAKKLAGTLFSSLRGIPFHVNLIPVNRVEETGLGEGTRAAADTFAAALCSLHINATVRRTLGPDISASCGQLRRKYMKPEN